jgi:hypothetical protein
MIKEKWEYSSKYLSFWFGGTFEISYAVCGYFDNRPRIQIALFLFTLILKLPFKNKWTDECDPPKWGIAYHGETLWIYRGGQGNMQGGNKWWTVHAPWSWQWVRTSYLRKDCSWEHEFRGDKRMLHRAIWDHLWWTETHPYKYILKSGEAQERQATLKVEEMEWRWHWFKWLKYPSKISTTISVEFDNEVGEGTGSWKGGVTGCGYELRRGESPLNCLRRMERERIFN